MSDGRSIKQLESDHTAQFEAVLAEYLQATESGEAPIQAEFLTRHPDLADELREFFANRDRMETLFKPLAVSESLRIETEGKPGRCGNYELLEEIARGGMGIVFRARQIGLNRIVALKMIREGRLSSLEDKRRFRSEAELAANLHHPSIVAIHEVGEYEGQPYFSMDYVEGSSLAEFVAENPLSPERAARYLKDAAEALAFAHHQGVLHRDLKPSNILVDTSDRVRITDFGLARRLHHDSSLTCTGQLLGTPSYMSPEQASGERESLGPASDIYSLGVVLYELLTGRPPFRAANPLDTLLQVKHNEPVSPRLLNPNVPRDLETICLKCLEKEPTYRYASAAALCDELKRFLCGEPVLSRPLGRTVRVWRWCRRKPLIASLTGAVAMLVVTVTVISIISAVRLRNERDTIAAQSGQLQRQQDITQQALYKSHLAEANARRWSGRTGRRFAALEAIHKAAKLQISPEVRNAAVSALSLSDLSVLHTSIRTHTSNSADAIAFDADQMHFTHGQGRTLVVRSAQDGSTLQTLTPIVGWPVVARFSPDGVFLAARTTDGAKSYLNVWRWEAGEPVAMPIASVVNNAFDFSSDARYLAVGTGDALLHLVELASGSERGHCQLASEPFQVCFSSAGDRIAATCRDGRRVQVWNHDLTSLDGEFTLPNDVYALAWNARGDQLAVGADFNIHLWDAIEYREQRVLIGHANVVHEVAFHPVEELLVSHCWSEGTRLWDTTQGVSLLATDGHFRSFNVSGSRLAFGDMAQVGVWQVAAGEECRRIRFGDDRHSVFDATFLSDESLALASSTGIRVVDPDGKRPGIAADVGRTWTLHWCAERRTLFAATEKGWFAQPWHSGAPQAAFALVPGYTNPLVHWCAVDRDGRHAVIVQGDPDHAWFVNLDSMQKAELVGQAEPYYADISPNGRWVALGSRHMPGYQVFDAENSMRSTRIDGDNCGDVAFSPDSSWLVTCGNDGYRVWRVGSWQLDRMISNQVTDDATAAFSPNGRTLAVTMNRNIVALLDPTNGEEELRLDATPAPTAILRLAFSSDGSHLACVCAPEGVLVWHLAKIRQALQEERF